MFSLLGFAKLSQICVNACMKLFESTRCGWNVKVGFMCTIWLLYVFVCQSLRVPVSIYVCVCQIVCSAVGVVRLRVASVCHISHGVLSAGPSGGPLRFMECHSVAAAVNQVNVADPISSVVLRSRWKNNI